MKHRSSKIHLTSQTDIRYQNRERPKPIRKCDKHHTMMSHKKVMFRYISVLDAVETITITILEVLDAVFKLRQRLISPYDSANV